MADVDTAITQLETLRKKPRSDLKEGLIQAVMVQPSSLEDKIRRIEMIDLLPEEPPPHPTPPPSHSHRGPLVRPTKPQPATSAGHPPAAVAVVDPSLDEPHRVEHFRRALHRPYRVGGFWAYLFLEYGLIRRFGFETGALVPGALPFTFRLSPLWQSFLSSVLWKQTLPVLESNLPLLLKKGWLVVSKQQYNYLVAAHHLCRALRSVGPHEGPRPRQAALWDEVLPEVRLFQTHGRHATEALRAWEEAANKLGVAGRSIQEGSDSLRTLLESRPLHPNLPDALKAVLMLRTKRAVQWGEGLSLEQGEYFVQDEFAATPEVLAEIERATELLARQLDTLAHEAHEISRIRYFLPSETLLDDFVPDAEKHDSQQWAQAFLAHVQESFTDLLEGAVVFANSEKAQLFSNPSLSASLERLAALREQMLDPVAGKSPEWVSATARVVMNLGKTLVVLIRNRSRLAEPLARSADPAQITDPLPFEDQVLDQPVEWAGLTVIQALVRAARICLLAGRHLGDSSLEASLEKEASVPLRARPILERYVQMAPRVLGEAKKVQLAWLFEPPVAPALPLDPADSLG